MDAIQMPPDIDQWSPEMEGAAPPVPVAPTQAEDGVPVIDSIVALVSGEGVYLQVAIIDPADDSVTPVLRWRVKDTGGGVPGAWVQQEYSDAEPDSGLILLSTGVVPAETLLEVQAAFRFSNRKLGTFSSPPEQIVTTVDYVAPDIISDLVVSAGAGSVTLEFQAPNSSNYRATDIYRNTSSDESSATVVRVEYGAPNASVSWTDGALAAGSYWYWLRSRNGSGVQSASVATGELIVT